MTAAAVSSASPFTVRPARPADNAGRCDLFARVAMETDLGLSVQRGPEFDALYRLQSPHWLSLIVDAAGAVEGTGTAIVRDGYVAGRVRTVGYLGDLRFSPRVQGRFILDRAFPALLEQARDDFGCELFLTAVIASNTRAVRALTTQTARSRAAGRPVYTPVGEFDIRSLHLLLPRRVERGACVVRRAESNDLPALARLLDADARRRPFGFVFTPDTLARRLREWPGLSIRDFYLATSPAGEPLGCLALWDAAPVKRMVVTAYRGAMRRVRFAHDLAATLLGRARLPVPGSPFRYQYVTHQAVPSDDPRVLRALLSHAYRDARAAGFHFLSACVPSPERSPLTPAFDGFPATNLRALLYVVALPSVDVSAVTTAAHWPGFEMALV